MTNACAEEKRESQKKNKGRRRGERRRNGYVTDDVTDIVRPKTDSNPLKTEKKTQSPTEADGSRWQIYLILFSILIKLKRLSIK